jgi:hypothetical protein
MKKKREGDREAAGEIFFIISSPISLFFIGDEKGELLKLL